jgi:hypothetical protein
MTHLKSALTKIAKQTFFGVAWLAFLVGGFIATYAVLEDFPEAEGKVAGLVLSAATLVGMGRGLIKLKAATVSENHRYASVVLDIWFCATIMAAVTFQSMLVEGGCSVLARTGTVSIVDCGYGPISIDTAAPGGF